VGRPIPTVSLYPAAAAFPITAQGRRPHWTFRGLLNVHWLLRPVGSPSRQSDPSFSKAPTVSFPPRVASIATGWSDPVAGQEFHLLKTNTFTQVHGARRVEMWRGGFRFGLSVSGPFVCRCLTSLTMLRFHIPLIKPGVRFSRTGLSDKATLILCFTRSPTNSCRYVPGSRYKPSFRYRCWSGNRAVPWPRTLNFTHSH